MASVVMGMLVTEGCGAISRKVARLPPRPVTDPTTTLDGVAVAVPAGATAADAAAADDDDDDGNDEEGEDEEDDLVCESNDDDGLLLESPF